MRLVHLKGSHVNQFIGTQHIPGVQNLFMSQIQITGKDLPQNVTQIKTAHYYCGYFL